MVLTVSYIENIEDEDVKELLGRDIEILEEKCESFVIHKLGGKEVRKDVFTACGKYKGDKCYIAYFNLDGTCLIIQNGIEFVVDRKELEISDCLGITVVDSK